MVTVTDAVADEVYDCTTTYLSQVETTVSHLPDAVEAYDTDPDAFQAATDRLRTCESECDATLRGLRTLLAESMPPNYTAVYLRVDDVVRLFDRLDAVPNRCERFVDELGAMDPGLRPGTRDHLCQMASLVVEATGIVADATGAYVETLLTEGERIRLVDEVDRVAALESDCDAARTAAMADAFAIQETADALVVRELVLSLEAAMDAVEDTGDRLLSMNSAAI